MATAEEILQTMAEVPESAPACVIDPETRTIIVPPEYQLFGVENDKRTERLYFQCPKIVGDNQDLSQDYQLFINYQNANGDPDAYHIEDMEVDGDNITFSWLLEENVTKYRGNIHFAFGAIIPGNEAEDPDKNRWNTTINTDCTCLVGLKCTQQVAESNPDALVQIWAAIDELKASGGGSGTGTGGTTNYNNLSNKPKLNGVTLEGNKTLDQVGVLAKNQGSSNSGKFLSVGSDGNVVPADAPSGGTVDPEQIKQAVNGYLEENPVSGMTAEQEQRLNQNTQDVADLKSAKVDKTGWGADKYIGTDSSGNIVEKDPVSVGGLGVEYDVDEEMLIFGGTSSIPSPGPIGGTGNLIDPSQYTNSGYAGNLFTQFGASFNVFAKEIDTSETKTFYYRVYRNNQVYNHAIGLKVGCYDSSGEWLYTMYDLDGDYTENFESYVRENGTNSEPLEIVDSHKVIVKIIGILTIPSDVSKIKIGINGSSAMVNAFYPVFAVSDERITNFGSITNGDYSLIQGEASGGDEEASSNKPLLNKLLGMMGDSLTNWGGGNDTQDGFLKIIHDRTGISTVNLGLAGATWEEADGQTQPGVTRVDTYVSGAVRYDCIAFLLGTNVANQGEVTDTSDTKTTMCGAIKYCLEQLITLSPTTPIIVFLPPQRAEGNTEQKARNDIIKQICEIYGVYTFDLYTRSQVIPNTTVSGNGTLSDGLHLSEKGQENFGRIMSTAILNVMGY